MMLTTVRPHIQSLSLMLFSNVAERTADDSRILSGCSDVQTYCSFESLWEADSAVSNKMTPWISPNKVPPRKGAHVSPESAFNVSSNYTEKLIRISLIWMFLRRLSYLWSESTPQSILISHIPVIALLGFMNYWWCSAFRIASRKRVPVERREIFAVFIQCEARQLKLVSCLASVWRYRFTIHLNTLISPQRCHIDSCESWSLKIRSCKFTLNLKGKTYLELFFFQLIWNRKRQQIRFCWSTVTDDQNYCWWTQSSFPVVKLKFFPVTESYISVTLHQAFPPGDHSCYSHDHKCQEYWNTSQTVYSPKLSLIYQCSFALWETLNTCILCCLSCTVTCIWVSNWVWIYTIAALMERAAEWVSGATDCVYSYILWKEDFSQGSLRKDKSSLSNSFNLLAMV